MPQPYRLPATAGTVRGELQLSPAGLSFTPLTSRDGLQLVLGIDGWQLTWHEIAGIERVDPHGRIRVHYDGAARFIALRVHARSSELFRIVDEQLAATPMPAALRAA